MKDIQRNTHNAALNVDLFWITFLLLESLQTYIWYGKMRGKRANVALHFSMQIRFRMNAESNSNEIN